MFVLLWPLGAAACTTAAPTPSTAPEPATAPSTAAAAPSSPEPARLAHATEVSLTVGDLDAAAKFFMAITDAELIDRVDQAGPEFEALTGLAGAEATTLRLRLGAEHVSLTHFETTGEAIPDDAVSNDLSFQHLALVTRDIDRAHARVLDQGGRAVSKLGVQTIPASNVAAAGIRAFYFRDPEGHPLELIAYPPDKGSERWHAAEGTLVLGIDHTAIAVSDTARSQAFYEALDLTVAGHSFNEGPEQERLSGVDGARVQITGLRGPEGIGVEFLHYESPGPGRSAASRPHDLAYVETSVWVPDLEQIEQTLRDSNTVFISRAIAQCPVCIEGSRAFVVRDPDGHAVRVVGE